MVEAGKVADPDQGVEALKGVGPSLADKLARLGVFRVGDLLLHLPSRYQDRSRLIALREVNHQQECLVQGQVLESRLVYGRRRSWIVTIEDGSGFLRLRFFHFSKQQQAGLQPGMFVRAVVTARLGAVRGPRTCTGLTTTSAPERLGLIRPESRNGRDLRLYRPSGDPRSVVRVTTRCARRDCELKSG